MLILIAESKTMTACDTPVAPELYEANRSALEAEADAVMDSLRAMTAEQLSQAVKISLPLARKLLTMIYEFPNKAFGSEAVRAFTGVVFKALDYPSLAPDARERFSRQVRIISSLYGWIKPEDIIKAYRFDFTTPLAQGGVSFASALKTPVTRSLLDDLALSGGGDVIDLLPGDAARCIDWKAVRETAKVWKIDFREMLPGGKTRTPNAGRLKTFRGQLLRQIVSLGITSPRELLSLNTDSFTPASPEEMPTDTIVYYTV